MEACLSAPARDWSSAVLVAAPGSGSSSASGVRLGSRLSSFGSTAPSGIAPAAANAVPMLAGICLAFSKQVCSLRAAC